ncbi:MAG TPA: hypothetical protein VMW19_22510 [Myxococcota bacterium]|nr:hypothetical protein [Myxococcota bacterium]
MIDARRRGWKLGAVLLALLFVALVASEIFARGRGGGGGGGGRGGGGFGGRGGGGYGGRSVSRSSPASGGLGSMQRSRSPSRGYSSTTRPSARDYGTGTAAGTRDYGASRPSTGRPVAPSTQPGGPASSRPGAPTTRPGTGDGGQRGEAAGDRQQQRQEAASDRMQNRDTNRDEAREDWQNHLDEAREDRQDYWENYDWDEVHVHDDDEFDWHSGTWIVITTGTAITYSAFDTMRAQPACNFFQTEVNGTVYYRCGSTWYIEAVTAGEVRYVAVEPPPGY